MSEENKVVLYGSEDWTENDWALWKMCYGDPQTFTGTPFEGDDTCNDGDGNCWWDGVSRRCDCGNRRVYWNFQGDFIYPEAW